MKRHMLFLLCLIISGLTYAGVYTAEGRGSTKTEACTAAKKLAATIIRVQNLAEVKSYGACDCSQSGNAYICSVDATY